MNILVGIQAIFKLSDIKLTTGFRSLCPKPKIQ